MLRISSFYSSFRTHNVRNLFDSTRFAKFPTFRFNSSLPTRKVVIGGVAANYEIPKSPHYVPKFFTPISMHVEHAASRLKDLPSHLDADLIEHLRWMLQKDLLQQDMFLLGSPGPLRKKTRNAIR